MMSTLIKSSVGLLLFVAIVIGALIFANRPSAQQNSNVAIESSEQLILGETIYQANCAQCHAVDGSGYANEALPAPALNGSEHSWHHSDDQILTLIRQGSRFMPAVGIDWSDEEVEAVWAYVKQWWSEEQKSFQQGSIGE